mgnify:CR=1 FL=1
MSAVAGGHQMRRGSGGQCGRFGGASAGISCRRGDAEAQPFAARLLQIAPEFGRSMQGRCRCGTGQPPCLDGAAAMRTADPPALAEGTPARQDLRGPLGDEFRQDQRLHPSARCVARRIVAVAVEMRGAWLADRPAEPQVRPWRPPAALDRIDDAGRRSAVQQTCQRWCGLRGQADAQCAGKMIVPVAGDVGLRQAPTRRTDQFSRLLIHLPVSAIGSAAAARRRGHNCQTIRNGRSREIGTRFVRFLAHTVCCRKGRRDEADRCPRPASRRRYPASVPLHLLPRRA